ncbi:hypothetical protein CHUAL_013644 [Chamberlinius hualienensis]
MAEVVDIVREYSKQFIMYPINEKLHKMETYFKQKLEQMEHLIQSNIQKSNLMDTTLETIQSKDLKNIQAIQTKFNERLIKLDGKSEFIFETNDKKHHQLSDMISERENKSNIAISHFDKCLKKLSKDFIEFEAEVEKKNKKFTEAVEQNTILGQQQNNKIEIIKIDSHNNLTLLNEEIAAVRTRIMDITDSLQYEIDKTYDQLQIEMRHLKEDNCNKVEEFRIVENQISSQLSSFQNLCERERNQTNKVLFTAAATIDKQSEMVERLAAATTYQSTKIHQLQDDTKDIKLKLGFLFWDFHEEMNSSYIETNLPDFTWEIARINQIIKEESQLISQSIEVNGYQIKTKVVFYIHSSYVYMKLFIEEGDSDLLKVKPSVTYIVKDSSGNERHLIRRNDVHYGLNYDHWCKLCAVSLLNKYVHIPGGTTRPLQLSGGHDS